LRDFGKVKLIFAKAFFFEGKRKKNMAKGHFHQKKKKKLLFKQKKLNQQLIKISQFSNSSQLSTQMQSSK